MSVYYLIVRLYTIITLENRTNTIYREVNSRDNGTYRISVTSLFILNGHAGLSNTRGDSNEFRTQPVECLTKKLIL